MSHHFQLQPVYHPPFLPFFLNRCPSSSYPFTFLHRILTLFLNSFFRFLNVLGNLILVCEYRRVNHFLPKHMIPFWRRITNPIMNFLIFWTYPQSVEQKYPPHWS